MKKTRRGAIVGGKISRTLLHLVLPKWKFKRYPVYFSLWHKTNYEFSWLCFQEKRGAYCQAGYVDAGCPVSSAA
jgi:hypothetical protein